MQKREKILAGTLAVVLAVMVGYPLFAKKFFGPITELKAKIKATKKKLDTKEQEELSLLRAASLLATWTDRSLPPDKLDAQRAYAAWLSDLADQAGWIDLQITPGRISKYGKSGNAVEVIVEGVATTDQVATFLNHFEGAALLQRIERLSFEPKSYAPDTPIKVKVTAEGISINNAKSHPLPFSKWKLAREFRTEETTLHVQSRSLYPLDGGFEIEIQNPGQTSETFVVKSVTSDGLVWNLKAVDKKNSPASKQKKQPNKKSQQFPQGATVTFKDDSRPFQTLQPKWSEFANASPFTHPRPVSITSPRIDLPQAVNLTQGENLELKVHLKGFSNAETCELGIDFAKEKPDGLSWDQKTRMITWKTTDSTNLGDYPLRLWAKAAELEKRVEHQLMIQVRKFNNPPLISEIPNLSLYAGEAWQFDIEASDQDEPSQKLIFSLQAEVPAELKIDPATGKLSWTPDQSLSDKEFQVSIQVADNGEPPQKSVRQVTLHVLANTEMTIELFACIKIDEKPTAWFRDVLSGKKIAINEGALFESGRFKATLIEIGTGYIDFQGENKRFRVELGQRINERTELEIQKEKPSAENAEALVK